MASKINHIGSNCGCVYSEFGCCDDKQTLAEDAEKSNCGC
jgi:hypothetical protein